MAIQTIRGVSSTAGRGGSTSSYGGVCRFWLAGKCTRNPCKFRHTEVPQLNTYHCPMKLLNPKSISKPHDPKRVLGPKQLNSFSKPRVLKHVLKPHESEKMLKPHKSEKILKPQEPENMLKTHESEKILKPQEPEKMLKPHESEKILKPQEPIKILEPKEPEKILKPQARLCKYWASGTCAKGEKCLFLHSWFQCKDFTLLANLQGHKKGIVGIGLPSGSDKLYSGSKDGTVRLWDCHSGECFRVVNMGQEIRSLVCEDSWVFIGLLNVVKAWNVENGATFELEGSTGQVYAMTSFNDLLFAGGQNGDILVWRCSSDANSTAPVVASLKGHTQSVTSLIIGANRLYSCSMDGTIRVWDTDSFVCLETLEGHSRPVTSLLCWDEYLLSSSLDQTIKVWGTCDSGKLEVIYTHTIDQGVLSLKGMHDDQGKPVILCGLNDNSMHVYDLPTFMERGRIFSKQEVSGVGVCTGGGLFFTGDGCGALKVWKWSQPQNEEQR